MGILGDSHVYIDPKKLANRKIPVLLSHDDQEKNKLITENEEPCTIIYNRDSFFSFKYPVKIDYKTLEKRYPFTCKEGSDFNCSILFEIKTDMTRDEAIHEAIRGYYHKMTIHIVRGTVQ